MSVLQDQKTGGGQFVPPPTHGSVSVPDFVTFAASVKIGRPFFIETAGPVDLNERSATQKFAICSIQHVIKTIAICPG